VLGLVGDISSKLDNEHKRVLNDPILYEMINYIKNQKSQMAVDTYNYVRGLGN